MPVGNVGGNGFGNMSGNQLAQQYLSGEKKPPSLRQLAYKEIKHFFDVAPLGKPVKVKPPEAQVFASSYDELA